MREPGPYRLCPVCGAERPVDFDWCLNCGFDFADLESNVDTGAKANHSIRSPLNSEPIVIDDPRSSIPWYSDLYAGTPYGRPQPSAPAEPSAVSMLAGGTWLAAAAISAYVALLQFNAHAALVARGLPGDLLAYAIVNGIAGALTVGLGVRLLGGPGRGFLVLSFVWGVPIGALGVYQAWQGRSDIVLLVGVAAGVAALLSLVALKRTPARGGSG